MTLSNWPRLAVVALGLFGCSVDDRAFSIVQERGSLSDEAGDIGVADGPGGATGSALQLDPTALDFGEVGLGQRAVNVLVARNAGAEPLGGLQAVVSGPDASQFGATLDARCAELAPGASCVISVTFAPASTGARSARLRLQTGGAVSTEVLLDATAVAQGALAADVASLDFGDQEVPLAGDQQTWVVRNAGTTPTAELQVEPSIAPHFEMTDNACRGSLAPGQSCQLTFRYHPATPGAHTGSVVVGDGRNQVSLTLVGRGKVRLTVVVVGRGTVTGPGIDCGATCSSLVDADELVVLEATTTNGSNSFLRDFSGATCTGPDRTCVTRLSATERVTATFAEQTNNLIFVASRSLRPDLAVLVLPRTVNATRALAGSPGPALPGANRR